jgi:two-component system chemotaxis sensor kinase CheA
MPHRASQTTLIAERIEQLTSELVQPGQIRHDAAVWIESLIQLAELAQSCGQTEVAGIAREVAGNIPGGSEKAADVLGAAMKRLREALRPAGAPGQPADNPVGANTSLAQDPELIADFVLESREHLVSIESQLLNLERNEGNTESVHAIFRSFHTIKGLAGFLEFALVQQVAHEVESILDRVRQGQLQVTPAIIDVVLESRDYIGCWLAVLDGGPGAPVPDELNEISVLLDRIRCADRGVPATAASDERLAAPSPGAEPVSPPAKESARSIKVSTDKLDYLVDMVGEMVIAQSLVRHDPDLAALQNSKLMRNIAQLARITNDVQRTAMAMRMVPIGSLFQKMARLVRDLSRKFGKQIEFESEGEDVELDRNIVEELADPLMHMVRNAIDHGIETTPERIASGKPAASRVSLRAFHRSGQIVIEVADDGRGINRERVLDKAKRKGLIATNAVLSDSECVNLIFQPGFSTVENVSDISGRGVGMDVVRKQISRLRGNIDIDSVEGRGTKFSLRLPLTLAIIDGLVVVVGSDRFIIPLASVKELLRPKPEMVSTVENHAEVVLIRDQLLPIVRLHERFGIEPKSKDPSECVLVVADVDGCSFCLMVDEMAGKQEVVIKSLGAIFQKVSGVAGGAILGDGQVGLILDLKGLFGGRKDV